MGFFSICCISSDILGDKGFVNFALNFSLLSVLAVGSNRAMNYPFHGGALFRHLC